MNWLYLYFLPALQFYTATLEMQLQIANINLDAKLYVGWCIYNLVCKLQMAAAQQGVVHDDAMFAHIYKHNIDTCVEKQKLCQYGRNSKTLRCQLIHMNTT